MKKKVLFRCDSSNLIGSGHVVRCLTLANYLRSSGLEVIFACRKLDGNSSGLIREKQFKVNELPAPSSEGKLTGYDLWRAVPLKKEISEFSAVSDKEQPDFVVVDHYGLPEEWETMARQTGAKVFVIDDIFHRHNCDALLCQNYHPDLLGKYSHLVPPTTQLFLGPSYALLSPHFNQENVDPRTIGTVKRVLIFFGGNDLAGETGRCFEILNSLKAEVEIDVVVGKNHQFIDRLKELMVGTPHRLYVQTSEMAKLMREADLFIGASGSTTWERCALGLPAICLAVAENQISIAESLRAIGVHEYLGEASKIEDDEYKAAIKRVMKDNTLRTQYSENSLKLQVAMKLKDLIDYFQQ